MRNAIMFPVLILMAIFTLACGGVGIETATGNYAKVEEIKATQGSAKPQFYKVILVDISASNKFLGPIQDKTIEILRNVGDSNHVVVIPIAANSAATQNEIWFGGHYGTYCWAPNLVPMDKCETEFTRTKCFGPGGQRDRQKAFLGEGGTVDSPLPDSEFGKCKSEATTQTQAAFDTQHSDLADYFRGLQVSQWTDIQGAIQVALDQQTSDPALPVHLVFLTDMEEDLSGGPRTQDIVSFVGRDVTIVVHQIVTNPEKSAELQASWTEKFNSWGAKKVTWTTFRIENSAPPAPAVVKETTPQVESGDKKSASPVPANKKGPPKPPKGLF